MKILIKISNNNAKTYFNFIANSHPNSDDEEEEDIDYSPEEDDFKKVNTVNKSIFKSIYLSTNI